MTSPRTTALRHLEQNPSDYGAWWRVAWYLGQSHDDDGRDDDVEARHKLAIEAFVGLGEACNAVGQVATAVGCATWLAGHGQKSQALALAQTLAQTHCQGSPSVDWERKPEPPTLAATVASDTSDFAPGEFLKRAGKAVATSIATTKTTEAGPLPATPFVRAMAPDDFVELVQLTTLRHADAEMTLLRVGEPADRLFWLVRGQAKASRGDTVLGQLYAGSFFGEIALVSGTTRTAQVTCVSESWLLEIPAEAVREASERNPNLARVLAQYARVRLLHNVMTTSPLFQRLNDEERNRVAGRFRSRWLAANTPLITKGETCDALYVIASGTCEVNDGGDALAQLQVGDGVGEMSLLSGHPAMADVVATTDAVVMEISREDFDDIVLKYPGLLAEVYRMSSERQKRNRDTLTADAEELIL